MIARGVGGVVGGRYTLPNRSVNSRCTEPLFKLTMIDCGVFNNADLGVNAGVVLAGWLPVLDLLDEAVGVVVEDAGFARPPRGMRSG